jgi:RNA polymerase sigma-70 factor (ECF subfamily)
VNVPASDNVDILVARARQGDLRAFEMLIRRYESYVYNLALRILGNSADAEDVAQQAFLRAWRGLPNFKGRSRFSTWLYRIVVNVCYNCLPSIRRELEMLVPDQDAELIPDERQAVEGGYIAEEERTCLILALESLPESARMLLTLRHLQEMSYDEIAQVTGMPLGTVKAGIFRARQRLKTALKLAENDDAQT